MTLDIEAIEFFARAHKMRVKGSTEAAVLLADRAPALIEEWKRLREFVDDLAAQGIRFDLNPTVDFARGSSAYIDYIARIDKSIRERAQASIK